MNKIKDNKPDLDRVCALCALSLSEKEKEMLSADVEAMLEFIDHMDSVITDTLDNSPFFPHESLNVQREDTVDNAMPREKLLSASPCVSGEYICVPLVISEDKE